MAFFDKLKDPQVLDMTKKVGRQIIPYAGGILTGMGLVSAETWALILANYETIVGGLFGAGSLIWMIFSNTKRAKAEGVANLKGFVVVAPENVARSSPNPDVISVSQAEQAFTK